MSRTNPKAVRWISVAVNDDQERPLRAAADLSGQTLFRFVLSAATERASDVLEGSQRIELDAKTFERFVAALDDPAEDMPTLRRYATRSSRIPSQ